MRLKGVDADFLFPYVQMQLCKGIEKIESH